MRRLWGVLLLSLCLTACSNQINYAPVMDIATIERVPQSGVYRVAPGETLYSIAWRYGMDYRYLAQLNHIALPYHVVAGQKIYLNNRQRPAAARSPLTASMTPAPAIEREMNVSVSAWRWPARGPVVGSYSATNKGINIGGHLGAPVYATASGQVVYSGNGLRGYGNLIIIKHNVHYLSAYAYNSAVLVKESMHVRAGQEIARMGMNNMRQTMLHFELRRNGQPVNPLNYLK